jgi:hypothetical protein
MVKRIVSGLYRLAVTVVAVVGCVGLMQVPQPWRGMLVLWLCGTGAVGALVFLALRQHHDFKAMQWQQGIRPATSRRRAARQLVARPNGLRVITSQGASRIQHIVR